MNRSPFHHALTLTFVGTVFVVTGLLGCRIRKSPWSIVACRWSDTVWWPEVWFGATALLVAAYFWKRAIRSLG